MLVPSDKQISMHNLSLCFSTISAREHVTEPDDSLKALSTYNSISNAVCLLKFCKMEAVLIYHQLIAQLEVEQVKLNKDWFNSERCRLLSI